MTAHESTQPRRAVMHCVAEQKAFIVATFSVSRRGRRQGLDQSMDIRDPSFSLAERLPPSTMVKKLTEGLNIFNLKADDDLDRLIIGLDFGTTYSGYAGLPAQCVTVLTI